jgi:hypothetical protein
MKDVNEEKDVLLITKKLNILFAGQDLIKKPEEFARFFSMFIKG